MQKSAYNSMYITLANCVVNNTVQKHAEPVCDNNSLQQTKSASTETKCALATL